MGLLTILTQGSFPDVRRVFTAMEHGHAHAVAEAIRFLADEVLPAAIEQDHRLHAEGLAPGKGFARPEKEAQ